VLLVQTKSCFCPCLHRLPASAALQTWWWLLQCLWEVWRPGQHMVSGQSWCCHPKPSIHSISWLWYPCSAYRLTAFVARSFGQASSYIYINKDHVQDAVLWLQKHQLSNGCFQSVGKLFNNDLKVWLMAMEVGMGGLGRIQGCYPGMQKWNQENQGTDRT